MMESIIGFIVSHWTYDKNTWQTLKAHAKDFYKISQLAYQQTWQAIYLLANQKASLKPFVMKDNNEDIAIEIAKLYGTFNFTVLKDTKPYQNPYSLLEASYTAFNTISNILEEKQLFTLQAIFKSQSPYYPPLFIVIFVYFLQKQLEKAHFVLNSAFDFNALQWFFLDKQEVDALFTQVETNFSSLDKQFKTDLSQDFLSLQENDANTQEILPLLQKIPAQNSSVSLLFSGSLLEEKAAVQAIDKSNLTTPALLNGLAKLYMAISEYDLAETLFKQVAQESKPAIQKEAMLNAYYVAIEQRNYTQAVTYFNQAQQRFAVSAFHSLDGFGASFIANYNNQQVIVKIIDTNVLQNDIKEVFDNLKILQTIKHVHIPEIIDYGFIDAKQQHAFIVIPYVADETLETYINQQGIITYTEFLPLIKPLIQACIILHQHKLYHLFIHPKNILIKNNQLFLINFGLAYKTIVDQKATLFTENVSYSLDYLAPEQLGKIADNPSYYTDIYSLAKLCCQALFNTTQPKRRDWQVVPEEVAALLEEAMDENINNRPESFSQFLERLPEVEGGINLFKDIEKKPVQESFDTQKENKTTGIDLDSLLNQVQAQAQSTLESTDMIDNVKLDYKDFIQFLIDKNSAYLFLKKYASSRIGQWQQAAIKGIPEAQALLGECFYQGVGKARNDADAIKWFKQGAEQDNPYAQAMLGVMYNYGYGVEKSESKAMYWFEKSAKQGDATGASWMGWSYEQRKEYQKAMQYYKQAAEQGDVYSLTNMGWLYEQGYGVAVSEEKAALLYEKAAEKDYPRALNNLGWLYQEGRGVMQNDMKAAELYRRAAEQGDVGAQTNLAWMHEKGIGVEQNLEEAAHWYQKAANQGHARAQNNLGYLYEEGRGVPKNIQKALELYESAAEKEDMYAIYNLGYLHENGIGVAKNKKAAVQYYEKAVQLGHPNAEARLKELKKGWLGDFFN